MIILSSNCFLSKVVADLKVELAIKNNKISELDLQIEDFKRHFHKTEEEKKFLMSEKEIERRRRQRFSDDNVKNSGELDNLKWGLREQEKQINDLERINRVLELDGKKVLNRLENEKEQLKKIVDRSLAKEEEMTKRNKYLENELESHRRKA